MPTTSAPTTSFPFATVANIFRGKCRLYYSKGTFGAADKPATGAAQLALYSGGTPVFVPMGSMGKEVGKITFKRNGVAIDFQDVPTDVEIDIELKAVTCTPEMLTALDSQELAEPISILAVPSGNPITGYSATDPAIHLCISGVTILPEGEIPLDGNPATITIKGKVLNDKITNVISFAKLTS